MYKLLKCIYSNDRRSKPASYCKPLSSYRQVSFLLIFIPKPTPALTRYRASRARKDLWGLWFEARARWEQSGRPAINLHDSIVEREVFRKAAVSDFAAAMAAITAPGKEQNFYQSQLNSSTTVSNWPVVRNRRNANADPESDDDDDDDDDDDAAEEAEDDDDDNATVQETEEETEADHIAEEDEDWDGQDSDVSVALRASVYGRQY